VRVITLKEKGINMHPATEALLKTIEDKRKEDPLIGAKIGAEEVFQRLLDAMKNDRGVHIESLLCALSALAGYSCQASLRAQALLQGLKETAALLVVGGADGKKYFFGDPLNNLIMNSNYSIWKLASGGAMHCGCKQLPDYNEIFKYVTGTVGGETFGIPRFPEGHAAGDQPLNYLKGMWPAVFATIKPFCAHPAEWPILFGIAIQKAIIAGKDAISPDIAMSIVMETVIPMSKVELVAP
jgi:hypothetical protein